MILIVTVLACSLHAMDKEVKLSDVYNDLLSGAFQTNSKSLKLIPKDQLISGEFPIEDEIFIFGDNKRKAQKNEVSFYRTTTQGAKIISAYIPVADGQGLVRKDKIENGKYPKCDISTLIHFGTRNEICCVNNSRSIVRLSPHAFVVNFLYICSQRQIAQLKAMINYLTPKEAASLLDSAQAFLPEDNQVLRSSEILDKVVCGSEVVDLKEIRKEKQEATQKADQVKYWKKIRKNFGKFIRSWKGLALGGLAAAVAMYWFFVKGQ